MNKKNWIWVGVVLGAVLTGFMLGNLLSAKASNESLFAKGKLLNVMSIIDREYVDSVSVDDLNEQLLTDLMGKLDPHSVYIPASDLEEVNSQLEGSFSGIGVQFNIQNDTVMIVAVVRGGPSEKVGLLPGDRIVEANDTSFVGKKITSERVMKTLRGKSDTKVKIGVKRRGTREVLRYTITRGEIPVNSIDISYEIAPGVGLIRVNKFAETTYKEFIDAIARLRAHGVQKYIIDLRENPGGLMDQAISMVNEFLPAHRMIVYAEGKAYPRMDEKSDGKGSCINQPIVVLIDEFSASASEIFSGAIQDNDRGLIIGRRSFGKGLVQQQIPLRDGSAIRLTVARYFTPSGRSIQKPYVKGKADEYEKDIMNRYKHGEFEHPDSIRFMQNKKYKTVGGRTVFGGGGIMPDIFVARDTSESTIYLNKVINNGYLYQFAFEYTDNHRAQLKGCKDWSSLQRYLKAKNVLADFVRFTELKGLHPTPKQLAISHHYLETQIQAYVSRNILGDDGFYPILFKEDKTVAKAIEVLLKK